MSEVLIGKARDLYRAGKFPEALKTLDAAASIYPNHAGLWNNRGVILAEMKRLEEASVAFGRATALDPNYAGAFFNRANTLVLLGRYEEAASDSEKALALDPKIPYARGNLLQCRLECCDWRNFDAERNRLIAELRGGARVASPFVSAALLTKPEDQLQCARIIAADKYASPAQPLWRGERYSHDRIRLAYVSADFHSHATATLMAGVFEHHDRVRFQPIAVSFGKDDRSPMRARLQNAFEQFIDATAKNDTEVAALLREMEIDIAVDLKGYTTDARPGIFAKRPSPIQPSYLGFPGTMAADFIDYIIADRIVIPETAERHYSEKVAYLPDCYQANDSARPVAQAAPTRAEAGLPENGFVFCCFNNSYKIAPDVFGIWMNLMRDVEDSVLWLITENAAVTRNLKHEAQTRGVAPERIVFAPRCPPHEHLARHRLADLFLDTLPYNAHTTASDALWAGLPLLTCLGGTFAGRVAGSLLQAIGLPEMVTDTLDAYEALALNLARDPVRLRAIKATLAKNRDTSALFDTARFTRHLEAAYMQMHERQQRGQPPASFAVEPIAEPDPG